MNVIDKVVIKNGVDADTVKTINLNTGQVDEINAILATISTGRGVASYNINSGKPQFVFSGVGDNEMWVYFDGIGIKVTSIATVAPDQSIKLLTYPGTSTYVITSDDNGKLLIVNDSTNITAITATAITDGITVMVLNLSNTTIGINRPGLSLQTKKYSLVSLTYQASAFDYYFLSYQTENYTKPVYYNTQVITYDDVLGMQLPVVELAYVGAKTFNITSWTTGKELKVINVATSGSATINFPDGETTRGLAGSCVITAGQQVRLLRGASGFWFYNIESIN